jgi:hypothetical protein
LKDHFYGEAHPTHTFSWSGPATNEIIAIPKPVNPSSRMAASDLAWRRLCYRLRT